MDTVRTVISLLIAAGAIAVGATIVIKSIFVVQQGTVMVVKRFGRHHDIYLPGPHFRIILVDTCHRIFSSQRQSLTLELRGDSGGRLPVDVAVELELRGVTDPETVLRLAYQIEDPMRHLRTVATAAARQLLLPMSFEDILTDGDLADNIRQALTEVAAECGFQIVSARITSIRPERSVHDAIVEGERAKHVRQTEAAEVKHTTAMELERAKTAAEVTGIELAAKRSELDGLSEQVAAIIGRLVASGTSAEDASKIVTALLYQQAVTSLSGTEGASLNLLPPGLNLDVSKLVAPLTAAPAA